MRNHTLKLYRIDGTKKYLYILHEDCDLFYLLKLIGNKC